MNATFFLMKYARLKKKKKKRPVTHPSLPSLTKAGMDNNEASSFQRLSLPISGVGEEAPGHEVT